jgi:hypothetical protein
MLFKIYFKAYVFKNLQFYFPCQFFKDFYVNHGILHCHKNRHSVLHATCIF